MPPLVRSARPIRLEVDVDRLRRKLFVAVRDETLGNHTLEIHTDHVRAIARCLGVMVERFPQEFPLSHARFNS